MAALTDLPCTSTTVSVSTTICGVIKREDLQTIFENHQSIGVRLQNELLLLHDHLVKSLWKILKSFSYFSRVENHALKELTHKMKMHTYSKNKVIVQYWQKSNFSYYVYKGSVSFYLV